MCRKCKHWQDVGMQTAGFCNLHKKTFIFEVCQSCPDSTEIGWTKAFLRTYRVGDKIASATTAIGIKPCSGCKKRQAILNGQ